MIKKSHITLLRTLAPPSAAGGGLNQDIGLRPSYLRYKQVFTLIISKTQISPAAP